MGAPTQTVVSLCFCSTDFGGEYEVTAHAFTGLGKSELVASEKTGMRS